MKQIYLLFLLFIALPAWSQKPLKQISTLRDGDLIFHVAKEPNAITESTSHLAKREIDHVAIYFRNAEVPSVIQAIGIGTVITPLDTFLESGETYYVGRLRKKFDVKKTLSNAQKYLGCPYDWLYLPDNDAIYCSELVQLSFVDNKGIPVFHTVPMSFHDDTGKILSYWTQFYQQYNMEVPEGKPGTNPAELSARKVIKLRYIITLPL